MSLINDEITADRRHAKSEGLQSGYVRRAKPHKLHSNARKLRLFSIVRWSNSVVLVTALDPADFLKDRLIHC